MISFCLFGLFNGRELIDFLLEILFLASDCALTCFFPKEFSQPLHLHFSEHGIPEPSCMSIHDSLITPSVVLASSPHLQACWASLQGGLFLPFKHLHLFKHCCCLLPTHGQCITFPLLSFTTQNSCDLDFTCRPQWRTFALLGNSSLTLTSPMQAQKTKSR